LQKSVASELSGSSEVPCGDLALSVLGSGFCPEGENCSRAFPDSSRSVDDISKEKRSESPEAAPDLACSAHKSFIDLESFEKVVSPIAVPVIIGVGHNVKEKFSAECCHKDKQSGVQAHLDKL